MFYKNIISSVLILLVIFLSFGGSVFSTAQASLVTPPTLLKDINTSVDSLDDAYLDSATVFQGSLYFAGQNDNAYGIWKSDGTEGGTSLVKNIPLDSIDDLSYMLATDDVLYFGAPEGLWKTDGTSEGTVKIKEFYAPRPGIIYNGFLYFDGNDGSDAGLWKTDGTEEGTVFIAEFDDIGTNFLEMYGLLYFIGVTELGGELWVTDGTTVGTEIVKDVDEGIGSGAAETHGVAGNTLYFSNLNGELWRSDGTEEGTLQVQMSPDTSFNASNGYHGLFPIFGYIPEEQEETDYHIYFPTRHDLQRYSPFFGEDPAEIVGTTIVFANFFSDGENPAYAVIGDKIYLTGLSGFGGDPYLYSYDTTTDDVAQVAPQGRTEMIALGGNLYFVGEDYTLQMYDGDTVTSLGEMTSVSEWHFFASDDRIFFGFDDELFTSDGTEEGTYSVMATDITSGSPSFGFIVAGENAFFTIDDVLWVTDGTPDGTETLGVEVSDPMPYAFNNEFFFLVVGDDGNEVWKSDGTEIGTVLVKDIGEYALDGGVVAMDDGLYFATYSEDQADTYAVWRSDGTTDGTEIVVGPNDQYIVYMYSWNNELYIQSDFYIRKVNIGEGTYGDQVDLAEADNFFDSIVFQDALYYITETEEIDSFVYDLYKTDGTADGTILLQNLGETESSLGFESFVLGDDYFFIALEGGLGVWRSDGTSEGTELVSDDGGYTNTNSLFLLGDTLYFSTVDEEDLFKLWKVDGIAEEAEYITSLDGSGSIPGPFGVYFYNPWETPLFSFEDVEHGYELWTSDGTAEGTELLEDVHPGLVGFSGSEAVRLNDTILFRANGVGVGFEPHYLVLEGDPESESEVEEVRTSSGSRPRVSRPSNPVITQNQIDSQSQPQSQVISKFLFVRTLKQTVVGEDVKELQKYLNANGFPVSLSGPGSLGNETNYFGPKTKFALMLFQKSKGLVPDGIMGPITRGVINGN